jgi:predicted transcriptional regulator
LRAWERDCDVEVSQRTPWLVVRADLELDTSLSGVTNLKAMEIHLPQHQEVQLKDLAVKTRRGTDELVQEAVAKLLSHNDWFIQQVQIGVDQIARGEFIEEEDMDARVERILQS